MKEKNKKLEFKKEIKWTKSAESFENGFIFSGLFYNFSIFGLYIFIIKQIPSFENKFFPFGLFIIIQLIIILINFRISRIRKLKWVQIK